MFGSSGGGGGLSLNDPFVQDIGVAAY